MISSEDLWEKEEKAKTVRAENSRKQGCL